MDVIWSEVLMYIGSMMFGWMIAEVFLAGLVVKFKIALCFAENSQKYCISIACDCCRLMVLLTIPTVVVLSICIKVGCCGWPSSKRTSWKTLASCAFRRSAQNLASAAEAATSLRMVHVT